MRPCLSFSILSFKSMKVGDHFDVYLGYILTMHYNLNRSKQTHKIAYLGVFAGSIVYNYIKHAKNLIKNVLIAFVTSMCL